MNAGWGISNNYISGLNSSSATIESNNQHPDFSRNLIKLFNTNTCQEMDTSWTDGCTMDTGHKASGAWQLYMECLSRILVIILRLTQNGHHFADDILKHIFFIEKSVFWSKYHSNFSPMFVFNNKPTLVQILALCCAGNKAMMFLFFDTYMCHLAYVI